MLRRFPVFGVFGFGNYPIQPVHVEDVAEVAIQQGRLMENTVVDVTGPDLVTRIRHDGQIHGAQTIDSAHASLGAKPGIIGGVLAGRCHHRAEIKGCAERDGVGCASNGTRLFSTIAEHGASFGKRYQTI